MADVIAKRPLNFFISCTLSLGTYLLLLIITVSDTPPPSSMELVSRMKNKRRRGIVKPNLTSPRYLRKAERYIRRKEKALIKIDINYARYRTIRVGNSIII